MSNIQIGKKYKISMGSGIDSNKIVTVVSPKEIKTDGRGIPTNVDGAYKPVDWKKEVAIKFDDGSLRTMYKNRLIPVNESKTRIFTEKELKEYIVKTMNEINESKKVPVKNSPDYHQYKIALDTVKNPFKGKFLGGIDQEEAILTLKKKFGFTDNDIKRLQKESIDNNRKKELNEVKPYSINRKFLIPGNSELYKTDVDSKDAEVFIYNDAQNRPCAIAFSGKANKPVFRYRFRDEKSRTDYIENFLTNIRSRKKSKEDKIEKRKNLENPYKVDDILVSSWGYDQTIVDFYQVVEVKGKTVTLQEINSKEVGPSGMMSTYVMPVKDSFAKGSKPFKKIVTNMDWIKLSHGQIATPWDGEKKYSSWYA